MFVFCVYYVGSGLCDELITCSVSPTGYLCDLETSSSSLGPIRAVAPNEKFISAHKTKTFSVFQTVTCHCFAG
jgi:hypothetical protein